MQRDIYSRKSSVTAYFIAVSFSLILWLPVLAGGIKGKVLDAGNHEQIVGAIIHIRELNSNAYSNLEGIFRFKTVPQGTYHVSCRFVGYKTAEKVISISDKDLDDEQLNFRLATVDTSIKEVTVEAKANTETDLSARQSEQKSDNVLNVMSAQTMQLSPDITVANSLQRISGVTVERNSTGDGQYAIVRGMDKRYNYTMVNGIMMPSPDDKNRYVPLDLFPNDLLDRIEVIKSLTPNMEGNAIGGAVNLQLKNAPDYLYVKGTVAGGMSQIFMNRGYSAFDASVINKKSPGEIHGPDYLAPVSDFPTKNLDYHTLSAPVNSLANVTIGDRFFKHKLGVLLTGSYQNMYRGANTDFFVPNAQPNPGNVPVFSDIEVRKYSTQQQRAAAHVLLDYQFNNRNSIRFYTLYVNTRQLQTRHTVDSVLAIQRTGPGSGLVEEWDRSILNIQSILNSTLQGDHILLPGLKLGWIANYAVASNNTPDWAEFKTTKGVTQDSMGNEISTPRTIKDLSHKWLHNTDKNVSGYLNLTYQHKLFGNEMEWMAGGMARHKTRDNYYNEYSLSPLPLDGPGRQYYTTFDNAKFNFVPAGSANGTPVNPNTYTATEDIQAGYIQAKYFINRLQVLAGVRVETTLQNYNETTEPAESFVGKTGTISYMDVLPGVHFKYSLTQKQNLRLSWYESISRPGFFEITPYQIPGEYFDEVGNPFLKHTTADNIDLRWEYFPKGRDQVLLGAFYKNIQDPIEYAFVQIGGPSTLYLQPRNFGTATNYGIEAVYTKYIGNFGVNANYTYTNSSITTTKELYFRDNEGSLTHSFVQQTRPLQGQAAHVANLSLIYKDSKHGLDLQLASVYTGRHIVELSAYQGLDYWQKATTQLDFSFEKSINRHISVYGKVTNILNTPVIVELDKQNIFRSGQGILPDQTSDKSITVEKDIYYQTYLLGLRFKL